MFSVFEERQVEKLHVKLSNGRMMSLEELVEDYERLLKKERWDENGRKLKAGQNFLIDRRIIEKKKEEIRRECDKAGEEGKKLWDRFEEANRIADKKYSPIIVTYVFPRDWKYKTEQELRNMCETTAVKFSEYMHYEGMCDEVICYLELQMRICNGEPIENLIKKDDKLPYMRIIRFSDDRLGYFGGGTQDLIYVPPCKISKKMIDTDKKLYVGTPYAFYQSFPHDDEEVIDPIR